MHILSAIVKAKHEEKYLRFGVVAGFPMQVLNFTSWPYAPGCWQDFASRSCQLSGRGTAGGVNSHHRRHDHQTLRQH